MSLTGTVFLTLVVLVTLASFALVVWLWPRLSGHTPGKIAGRVGMLVVVNLLVLLTAATQLNAYYLFFADWTDLQGAMTGKVTATPLNRGTTAATAMARKVRGTAARAAPHLSALPKGVRGSGIATFTVKGPVSGVTGSVVVRLPPGYDKPSNKSVRYPVIETFSGYPGSPLGWIRTMNIGGIMSQQVAAGHMRQAIVVSPNLEIPPGVDTECVNGASGYPQLETWLTRDVPDWVARTFRVRTDRQSWATAGLSAGGWCAAMATMLHPAQYGAAIVLGGYFYPDFSPFYEPYPPNSPLNKRYNLVTLARHAPPPVAMWLETSHMDPLSYRSTSVFLHSLKPPLAVHAVVLQHAGHRIGVWEALLPSALRWLGASLAGFR